MARGVEDGEERARTWLRGEERRGWGGVGKWDAR